MRLHCVVIVGTHRNDVSTERNRQPWNGHLSDRTNARVRPTWWLGASGPKRPLHWPHPVALHLVGLASALTASAFGEGVRAGASPARNS
jgi:hypothetical protein